MIPQETVDKILDSAQIVDVIGDFVTLKKRGANHIACCPFHNEKTPSFSVSATKGIYKCFGCGKSGTAVGFVMEHENMSYTEALKYLARKYHIEVVEKEETAEEIIQRQRYESLLLLSEFAGKFFQESMNTADGQNIAYQYFRSRGLEDDTIRKYGLGWAPLGRKAFSEAARAAGYKEEYMVETGLSIRYDDGKMVDRFFDRVMFPIHSVSGRIIAFGGRSLKTDKSVPKYVNSPETEIYVKSKSLYGIYFAKSEISRQNKCILVEGYLDVLSMHQLGIRNVVASSGTSLTVDQIRLIRKFTNNVTILYDGDLAGIKAALRGIGLVLKEGLNVKIVLLPDGQDPDDFAKKHTLEEFKDHISRNEQDFINFKTDLLLGEAGNDPIKRADLINDIADTIALIPDAVIRAVYVHTCADKFEIDEQILTDRVNRSRTQMLLADEKQKDRERQRMEAKNTQKEEYPLDDGLVHVPVQEVPVVPELPSDIPVVINEPYLAPCEKELLGFILEEGCTELQFDMDSKYYVEGETVNVAEFIDGILAADDADFVNMSYRKVYELYFSMYEEGLTQQQMQTRLLNSMEPDVSAVAKELLIEKYQITVKNYEQSLTATSTRLVQYIPKTLLAYQCKKVELILKDLTAELSRAADIETQMEIMIKIGDYNRARTRLNNELGRV